MQRSINKVESYLPACNVFGGIWRSFSGAAYWMVCNSCLRVASPLAKPASTQSQWRVGLELASHRWHNARTAPRRPRLDTSQSYFYRPLSRRLDRCDRVIHNESRDPFGGNVYYVTMQITFLTRKFRNKERNLHCDVVHITTKWVSSLTLDCNGVFAIKAYDCELHQSVGYTHWPIYNWTGDMAAFSKPPSVAPSIYSSRANRAWGADRWRCREFFFFNYWQTIVDK